MAVLLTMSDIVPPVFPPVSPGLEITEIFRFMMKYSEKVYLSLRILSTVPEMVTTVLNPKLVNPALDIHTFAESATSTLVLESWKNFPDFAVIISASSFSRNISVTKLLTSINVESASSGRSIFFRVLYLHSLLHLYCLTSNEHIHSWSLLLDSSRLLFVSLRHFW